MSDKSSYVPICQDMSHSWCFVRTYPDLGCQRQKTDKQPKSEMGDIDPYIIIRIGKSRKFPGPRENPPK